MTARLTAFAMAAAACLSVNAADAPGVVRSEKPKALTRPDLSLLGPVQCDCYFVLRLQINAAGKVSEVHVAERGFANRNAIAEFSTFVSRIKFKPATRNGVPVASTVFFPVSISTSTDKRVSEEFRRESTIVVDLIAAGDAAGASHHAEYMLSDIVRSRHEYLGLQGTMGQAFASAGRVPDAISALRKATQRSQAAPKFDLDARIPGNKATNYQFNNKDYISNLLDLRFRLAAKEGYYLEALQTYRELSGLVPMDPSDPRVVLAGQLTQALRTSDELIGNVTLVPGSYDGVARWNHKLYRRSFTLDKVQGEISGLALNCGADSRELAFGEGLEWAVPADWEECELEIMGAAGATLQVIEFAD